MAQKFQNPRSVFHGVIISLRKFVFFGSMLLGTMNPADDFMLDVFNAKCQQITPKSRQKLFHKFQKFHNGFTTIADERPQHTKFMQKHPWNIYSSSSEASVHFNVQCLHANANSKHHKLSSLPLWRVANLICDQRFGRILIKSAVYQIVCQCKINAILGKLARPQIPWWARSHVATACTAAHTN